MKIKLLQNNSKLCSSMYTNIRW